MLLDQLIAPLQRTIKILGDRAAQHGDHVKLHRRIAKLWSVYLGIWVKPHQVPAMMMLYKLGRSEANPDLDDNIHDMLGNTTIYGDLLKIGSQREPHTGSEDSLDSGSPTSG